MLTHDIFLESSAQAQLIGTLVLKGSGCLVITNHCHCKVHESSLPTIGRDSLIEMHEISPSRPRGCVQANYQQLIPNSQFMYCILHKLHD